MSDPIGARLARSDDLAEGEARVCDVRDGARLWSYVVLQLNGSTIAYDNLCPHARFPLERMDGGVTLLREGDRLLIQCAAHGAAFDAATGACVAGPGTGRGLRRVAVAVADGDVRIAAPPQGET
ncbi:MAG: Rieske 2Fe-2S domain-containing protein [Hyphomonadaceae bacterium]|nr:Rieske 2Fe-2S domain-containing protein [Hyphomonadaceae bacterium]